MTQETNSVKKAQLLSMKLNNSATSNAQDSPQAEWKALSFCTLQITVISLGCCHTLLCLQKPQSMSLCRTPSSQSCTITWLLPWLPFTSSSSASTFDHDSVEWDGKPATWKIPWGGTSGTVHGQSLLSLLKKKKERKKVAYVSRA